MNTASALQWELHAAGSHITFSASRGEDRYDLVMRKDNTVLLADVAKDTATLLRKSSRLRSQLQELGYVPDPAAACELTHAAGAC